MHMLAHNHTHADLLDVFMLYFFQFAFATNWSKKIQLHQQISSGSAITQNNIQTLITHHQEIILKFHRLNRWQSP